MYRPVPAAEVGQEAFLNFRGGTRAWDPDQHRCGLVAQGLLEVVPSSKRTRQTRARRTSAPSCGDHVSTAALAKGFHLNSGSLARHLPESAHRYSLFQTLTTGGDTYSSSTKMWLLAFSFRHAKC